MGHRDGRVEGRCLLHTGKAGGGRQRAADLCGKYGNFILKRKFYKCGNSSLKATKPQTAAAKATQRPPAREGNGLEEGLA